MYSAHYFGLDPPRLPPLPELPELVAEAVPPCDELVACAIEDAPLERDRDSEAKDELALSPGDPARSVTGPALAP
jgi:hypothetical protein